MEKKLLKNEVLIQQMKGLSQTFMTKNPHNVRNSEMIVLCSHMLTTVRF